MGVGWVMVGVHEVVNVGVGVGCVIVADSVIVSLCVCVLVYVGVCVIVGVQEIVCVCDELGVKDTVSDIVGVGCVTVGVGVGWVIVGLGVNDSEFEEVGVHENVSDIVGVGGIIISPCISTRSNVYLCVSWASKRRSSMCTFPSLFFSIITDSPYVFMNDNL